MTEDELKQFEQFKRWQQQEAEAEAGPAPQSTPSINKIIDDEKEKFKTRQPMVLPREYMYAGAAGGAVLILTAWPVLILGAVIGAYFAIKLGCNCKHEK